MTGGWQVLLFRAVAWSSIAVTVLVGYLALAGTSAGLLVVGIPLLVVVLWCQIEVDRQLPTSRVGKDAGAGRP